VSREFEKDHMARILLFNEEKIQLTRKERFGILIRK